MLESESGRWETLAMLARCHGFAPTSPCFRASKPQENSLNLRCHFMSSFEAMVKYGKMVGSKSSTNVQSWDAPEVEAVEGGRPASSAILELAQFFSFNQRQQDHPNAPAARPSATFVDNSSEPRKRRRQSSIKNRGPSHQVEHSSCKCNLRTPNVWWKRKFPKKKHWSKHSEMRSNSRLIRLTPFLGKTDNGHLWWLHCSYPRLAKVCTSFFVLRSCRLSWRCNEDRIMVSTCVPCEPHSPFSRTLADFVLMFQL